VSSSDPTSDDPRAGLREWLVIYAKGLTMGAADAVPGISGGTLALITGIYERLIRAVTALDPTVLRLLPRLHREGERRQFRDALVEMDVPFLVVLAAGMGSALVILARVVQAALSAVPGPTFAFFFGLIGASAIVLGEVDWLRQPGPVVAGVAGFVFAFLVAGVSGGGNLGSSPPVIFVAGMVAISGMLLPGISGAFILLLLGQYDYMTATLNEFVDGAITLVTGGGPEQFLREGAVVLTFLGGAVVGLFTVAYAVRFALDHYRTATLSFLVSLMLGALRLPVIEIRSRSDLGEPTALGIVVLAAVVGTVIILVLDQQTNDLKY
jgi:putative membrane protein